MTDYGHDDFVRDLNIMLNNEYRDFEQTCILAYVEQLEAGQGVVLGNGESLIHESERDHWKAVAEWLARRLALNGFPTTSDFTLNAKGEAAATDWLAAAQEAVKR